MKRDIRVGLFGIGLDTYWGQFDGLLDRLTGYQHTIRDRLQEQGCRVADAGMIDSPLKISAAVELFQRERIEILFLYVSTYALSSTVLPVAQRQRASVYRQYTPVNLNTKTWWCRGVARWEGIGATILEFARLRQLQADQAQSQHREPGMATDHDTIRVSDGIALEAKALARIG